MTDSSDSAIKDVTSADQEAALDVLISRLVALPVLSIGTADDEDNASLDPAFRESLRTRVAVELRSADVSVDVTALLDDAVMTWADQA